MKPLLALMSALSMSLLSHTVNANPLYDQNWQLVPNHSQVSFVTVKKSNISENNHFKTVRGEIEQGQAKIWLDAASVETIIPIRNERIRKFVLQTERYPEITVMADLAPLKEAKALELTELKLPATLTLSGVKKDIQLPVQLQPLQNGKISVSTTQPVIVYAKNYALEGGVQKLSEIMGGIHISDSVPVTFNLVFQSQP